jgi:cell division protein ZapA (FtsZ GTPase activity inhibitor)
MHRHVKQVDFYSMSEISIKVNIGTRTYPLSVKPEEEEVIRLAAKNINDSIKNLQENYAVKDVQDLLAMTALQLATQQLVKKPVAPENTDALKSDVDEINRMIEQALSEN